MAPRKAAKLYNALNKVEVLPSDRLLKNYKVKSVGQNLFSYKVDADSRIIFGDKDNKRIILDVVDTGMVRNSHHVSAKTHKTSIAYKRKHDIKR